MARARRYHARRPRRHAAPLSHAGSAAAVVRSGGRRDRIGRDDPRRTDRRRRRDAAYPATVSRRCAAEKRMTRIPFSMLVALGWRNLWRQRRRNGMLLAAILVAVMGATFATALIRGYQRDLADDAVANLTGHVKALADGYLADPSLARSFALAP